MKIKNLNQICCKIAPNMNEITYCKERERERERERKDLELSKKNKKEKYIV